MTTTVCEFCTMLYNMVKCPGKAGNSENVGFNLNKLL